MWIVCLFSVTYNGYLLWILVNIEDTYVTLFSNDFANNVFCNQLLCILTHDIGQ